MANHFPVVPAMNVANVQYRVHMTPVAGNSNSTPQQQMALVQFGFERTDGQGVITFDYTAFDQDAYETGLRTMLNSICTSWSSNVGATLAAVQAAMTVERVWTFGSASTLQGSAPQYTLSDTMIYP
jgi:hypothetical protein